MVMTMGQPTGITREQAMTANYFHYGECQEIVGARGGRTYKVERWRRNGATKTWKREPERFRVPVKHGLRGYAYLTDLDAQFWHEAKDCPIPELRAY